MPVQIKNGYSREILNHNIGVLIDDGFEPAQAAAIAYKHARAAYKDKSPGKPYPDYLSPKNNKKRQPRRNPAGTQAQRIEAAENLYRDFTGHEPDNTVDIVKLPAHDTGILIGNVVGIIYDTVRDGKDEQYIHEFKPRSRPQLAASHDGTQLYILGGGYTFKDTGINDN